MKISGEIFFSGFGIALSLALSGEASAATNYFVSTTGNDSNPGTTRTNAWRTIQSAVNRVTPGDMIIVLAGTYAGALIERAGLSNAPIALKADDGAAVLLNTKNPIGNSTHNSIIWLEDWDGYGPVSYWITSSPSHWNNPAGDNYQMKRASLPYFHLPFTLEKRIVQNILNDPFA